MALSNLTKEPGPSKRGPDCTVCAALKELPKKQAALLLGALQNPRWRYSEIADEIAADETLPDWIRAISQHTLGHHARGNCRARTKLR